jgi:hypothetical protein
VVKKDPVELEKYSLPEEDIPKHFNFVEYIEPFISTVTKYYSIVCLNSKFPPTLHSTLEIQPATLFGEKCVILYL